MAQKIGPEQARKVGDIHELYAPPRLPENCTRVVGYETLEQWKKEDTAMDKYNNEIGAELGSDKCNKDCCQACIAELEKNALKVNKPDGYSFVY